MILFVLLAFTAMVSMVVGTVQATTTALVGYGSSGTTAVLVGIGCFLAMLLQGVRIFLKEWKALPADDQLVAGRVLLRLFKKVTTDVARGRQPKWGRRTAQAIEEEFGK